jgi:hypothetical protein
MRVELLAVPSDELTIPVMKISKRSWHSGAAGMKLDEVCQGTAWQGLGPALDLGLSIGMKNAFYQVA